MKKKDEIDMQQPMMVSSHDVKLDADYAEWIAEVKHRYRSAQVKAAVKVNAEKLLWNWQMGRDLVQKKAEERWGAGVVEQVSMDLQNEFPGEKGFSATNLWYMKKWYLYYTRDEATQKLDQVVRDVYLSQNKKDIILHQLGGEIEERKPHQSGGEFPLPFALVPWKHHVEIITKCETIEKALFYICKTIEQGLSRDALINCINAKLYETQGKIVNNFSEHMPEQQSKLIQEVLKNYFKEHQDYYKRMVAAYPIGFSITKDDLEQYPYLKFATGESDTGVIISYNTEGPQNVEENARNVVVLPGAMSINPLNWKLDETYAPASENKGSLVNNKDTGAREFVDLGVDAKINLARGVIVTNTTAPVTEGAEFFGPASFHENDYSFFYKNLQENVAKRVAAWKSK